MWTLPIRSPKQHENLKFLECENASKIEKEHCMGLLHAISV